MIKIRAETLLNHHDHETQKNYNDIIWKANTEKATGNEDGVKYLVFQAEQMLLDTPKKTKKYDPLI